MVGAIPTSRVDALSIRVREGGRVVKVACIVATAVNSRKPPRDRRT